MKFVFFLLIILLNVNYSQSNLVMKNKLIYEIDSLKSELDGELAIVFVDPRDNDKIFLNENVSFHAASTMKLAVMLELLRQASSGALSLNDSIYIHNDFHSIVDGSSYSLNPDDDSDSDLYLLIGKKLTYSELNYRMITLSSNLATNILIEILTPTKIMETMKLIGANNIKIIRGVEDILAFRNGLNNTTTAFDLYKVLEAIYQMKITNESCSKEMIRILSEQKHNDLIPALLPSEIKIAHKTGWITGVKHDAAICVTPDGNYYYLILLTKNLNDEKKASSVLQKISFLIYEYFIKKNIRGKNE